MEAAEDLYQSLSKKGAEVILDDRDERPGVKFKDADLIGIPIRVTVGRKALKENQVELKLRREPERQKATPDEVVALVLELKQKLYDELKPVAQ